MAVGAGRTAGAGDASGRHDAANIGAYQCDQGPDARSGQPDLISSITHNSKQ